MFFSNTLIEKLILLAQITIVAGIVLLSWRSVIPGELATILLVLAVSLTVSWEAAKGVAWLGAGIVILLLMGDGMAESVEYALWYITITPFFLLSAYVRHQKKYEYVRVDIRHLK